MEIKKIFERPLAQKYDFPPTKADEGIVLTTEGDILEGGTVKDVKYINGDKVIDLDGTVETATKEVNLKTLVVTESKNSPFTIDPTTGYTSMKQVKVTAALKELGTVNLESADPKIFVLEDSDPEYGIKSVTVQPIVTEIYAAALTSASEVVIDTPAGSCGISKVHVSPALQEAILSSPTQGEGVAPEPGNYCGLSEVTVVYGAVTVDDLYNPQASSISGDATLNNLQANGNFPVVIKVNGTGNLIYCNADITKDTDGNVTQVIIYGMPAPSSTEDPRHITITRSYDASEQSWSSTLTIKKAIDITD